MGGHIGPPLRKKKSSVVPLIPQRSHIGNLRQIRKQGKGRSSKRKGNRRVSPFFSNFYDISNELRSTDFP